MNRIVSRRRVSGVSLLEMLMVIALIAAASLLAAAILSGGMEGMKLRSSAKEIASELRFTRTRAIATGEAQRFTIDPVEHRWEGPNRHHGEIPRSLAIQFTGARQAGATDALGGIVFFPDGASTGGRIQLQRDKSGWRIDVIWLTGEVRLSRLTPESPP
ncbi:MAG: GspH/FimT family pseudopilin [Xanthomonadaceae bacterium]|jgi:general secretion pathway protein H|nr:GspH/FimT family pseudopilin [Xanthomonadaceae bacterium]